MKSRFPGTCKGCGQPYARDAEIHWSKQDGGWHPRCWFERPQHIGPDAVELAERLGFLPHERAGEADWPLLLLSEALHRRSTGREEPEAPARRDATLFEV